jgi:3-hydroxyacyl-[acyl-carrier-protein] dehydratase
MTDTSDAANPEATQELETADIKRIMELLPHRYPMLLIDRIVDMKGSESAIGIKNVTINDNFFQGHFPDFPVMPGVLIVEAMAQTAGALVVNAAKSGSKHKVVYFMTIDKARFRRPVVPGDRLEVHVRKMQNRGSVWKFHGDAKVDGKVVAEADYSAMIVEPEE